MESSKTKEVAVKDLKVQEFSAKNFALKHLKVPEWSEPIPGKHYFQVIKKGVILNNIHLSEGKMSFTIGRSDGIDGKLDHYLVSRSHLFIVYGKGPDCDRSVSKFWVADLFTQNKSKVNRLLMKPGQFYPIEIGFTLQLAEDTFTLVLEGPQPLIEENETKARNSSLLLNPDMELQKDSNKKDTDKNNQEEFVKEYFDQKNLEPDYEVDTLGSSDKATFKAKLALTIYDEEGNELTVEGQGPTRAIAISVCAQNAAILIKKYDPSWNIQLETEAEKRKRVLIENDYYDDEDDSFYDRSGEIEKKRVKRMERLGIYEKKPETSETLVAKIDLIIKDMEEIKIKLKSLNETKNVDEDEDEIDKYMNEMQVKIDKKLADDLNKRLENLSKEKYLLEQRLGFSVNFKPEEPPVRPSSEDKKRVINYGLNIIPKEDEIKDHKQNKPDGIADLKTATPSNVRANKGKSSMQPTLTNFPKTAPSRYCQQEEEFEWIPPNNQSGDGTTTLNKRFNY